MAPAPCRRLVAARGAAITKTCECVIDMWLSPVRRSGLLFSVSLRSTTLSPCPPCHPPLSLLASFRFASSRGCGFAQ
eukprot:1394708-Pyramimonas_sp.AAC.1